MMTLRGSATGVCGRGDPLPPFLQVRIPKRLRLLIPEVLQMRGLQTDNFGSKHGVCLELLIIEDLGIRRGFSHSPKRDLGLTKGQGAGAFLNERSIAETYK